MQQQCWNDWEVKRETEYGGCWIRSGYKANSGQKQLTDYQSASAMASCLVGHHWLCQKTGTARNIHIGRHPNLRIALSVHWSSVKSYLHVHQVWPLLIEIPNSVRV